jgi:hypothetical protein
MLKQLSRIEGEIKVDEEEKKKGSRHRDIIRSCRCWRPEIPVVSLSKFCKIYGIGSGGKLNDANDDVRSKIGSVERSNEKADAV